MDCPRCGLSVQTRAYEGESVYFCGICWGFWLKRSQLDDIVGKIRYGFSKDEKRAVLTTMAETGDADRQGSEEAAITCPECSKPLEKKRYDESCPVVIDECDDHGIWLDTGEIKDLQVFLEQNLKDRA